MSDINPYAAPRVPDPLLDERGPAGGPWRDGKYLVVHRLGGAAAPHLCLITGEPAEMSIPVPIQWSYPVDYSMRTTLVNVGLTRETSRRATRNDKLGCVAHLVSIPAILMLVALGGQMPRPLYLVLMTVLITCAVLGIIFSHFSKFLRFAKARGEFIWLRGAGPRFLDQLPVWPGR
jgi:hypothetical protein